MKNLENYGVQNLSAKEITEIDGGTWPFFFAGLSYLFDVGGIRTVNNEIEWV